MGATAAADHDLLRGRREGAWWRNAGVAVAMNHTTWVRSRSARSSLYKLGGLMLATATSIVGLIGLVATIALLAWQSRAAAKQAEVANAIAGATVLFTCTASLHEVLRLFVQQPELRAYFYAGAPCPTHGLERDRMITIAEMLADTLEDGLVAHRLVPASESETDWIGYCRQMRSSSPTLDMIIDENVEWWPQLARLTSGASLSPRQPFNSEAAPKTSRSVSAAAADIGERSELEGI